VAAIDIGSNTVHMVIMDVAGSRPPVHRWSESVILKLGAATTPQKTLPPDVFHKLRHTLKRFLRHAKKEGAGPVLIGATQAIRSLRGGEKVLARLSRDIGAPIYLLSGKREAELGFLGVKTELRPRECQLIVDSGGASTELTLADGSRVIESVTIPLGAAVLSTRLKNDPPTAFEVARLMIPIIQALRGAPDKGTPLSALLTGGTAHHLLDVAKADPRRLARRDLEHALKRLLRKSAKKIAKKFGMEVERARLLVPGALLVTALLDHYDLDHLRITTRGLRDGMACAYIRKGLGWWK
jgi:exopolyphosphatase/guanosine-5'-triphosphate,3'-diphosphate pyrophosphatase